MFRKLKKKISAYIILILLSVLLCAILDPTEFKQHIGLQPVNHYSSIIDSKSGIGEFDYNTVPEWDGFTPWVVTNNNQPFFKERTTSEFELYSNLDMLGRCGTAFANISPQTMPSEERGEIGSVKPSGWHTVRYAGIDGNYLFNRCHLIGFQLAGENANPNNLITGTRWLNIEGMLSFENAIAEYVRTTKNHVMYRVTPIFVGVELVCRGVLMEAYSVEDGGTGVQFCVFAYNEQPNVTIDHLTGDSTGPAFES